MTNINDTKQRIFVGKCTIWFILAVSLAASLAYWYTLSGLESSNNLSASMEMLLYLIVGVGLAAEIVKKVTLSTFRNFGIWLMAMVVSIITVMGTYSILDMTRQTNLTKQSDSYQSTQRQQDTANNRMLAYGYAANYNIEDLQNRREALLSSQALNNQGKPSGYTVQAVLSKGWKSYAHYQTKVDKIDQQIAAKRTYDSAETAAETAANKLAASNTAGGEQSSNPLLTNMAVVAGISAALLSTLFYLMVTILLEWAAYWIGGRVEELEQEMRLTKEQIINLQVKNLYGFSLDDIGVKSKQQPAQTTEEQPQPPMPPADKAPVSAPANLTTARGIGFTSDRVSNNETTETRAAAPAPIIGNTALKMDETPYPQPAKTGHLHIVTTPQNSVTTARAQPKQAKQPETAPQNSQNNAQTEQNSRQAILELIWQDYAQAMKQGELDVKVRDQRTYISRKLKEHNDHMSIAEIGELSKDWLERAHHQGIIENNPRYTESGRVSKYQLKK